MTWCALYRRAGSGEHPGHPEPYSGGTDSPHLRLQPSSATPLVAITIGGNLARSTAQEGGGGVRVAPGYQPRAALLRILTPLRCPRPCRRRPVPRRRPRRGARALGRGPTLGPGPRVREPAKQLAAPGGAIPCSGRRAEAPVARAGWAYQRTPSARRRLVAPELENNENRRFAGTPPSAEAQQLFMLRDRAKRQVQRRSTSRASGGEAGEGCVDHRGGGGALAATLEPVTLGDYARSTWPCSAAIPALWT